MAFRWNKPLLEYQRLHKKPIDLRELAAVFRTIGLDENAIGQTVLQVGGYLQPVFQQSDPEKIWPYFAEHLDLLSEAPAGELCSAAVGHRARQ
jgi:hypothetical protein